jgi:hypothetical protein
VEQRTPADQHDTVILPVPADPAQAAPAPAHTGPQGQVEQHDTVVLRVPSATSPASAASPASPGPAPVGSWAMGGWQPVSDPRTPTRHYPPNVWAHVPPFLPPAAPHPRPVLVMRNNAAVVGATLGSVSLFLSLLPLIGIVAWVLAPIGLLSSAVGLFVGFSRKVGRVGAVWGLLTSGLALLVCLAWTALLLAL